MAWSTYRWTAAFGSIDENTKNVSVQLYIFCYDEGAHHLGHIDQGAFRRWSAVLNATGTFSTRAHISSSPGVSQAQAHSASIEPRLAVSDALGVELGQPQNRRQSNSSLGVLKARRKARRRRQRSRDCQVRLAAPLRVSQRCALLQQDQLGSAR